MSFCMSSHQTCCEKTINNIIDERKDQIKTATILFYYQTVPDTEYLGKLHKNVTPARVALVTKDFSRAWDEALEQVRRYKKRVLNKEIDLEIILHDIEFFIKHEKTNYDTVKRNFNVKLAMIEEERQRDIIEKIDELDILFSSYMDDLENKKKLIAEAEDYIPLVIDEINCNLEWFCKQRRQAEQKFKEKIDCMIAGLINSSIVKTYKAGKNITLSILKLEEKLRQKRIEMGGADLKDVEDEVSEEIAKLQKERSSLDYQAATLVELESTFQKLLQEQNEIFEIMKRLEEKLQNQIQEIMCNICTCEEDKECEIRELRCKYDHEIGLLQEREDKIHGKIERIRQELLSRHEGFDIELLDKLGLDMKSCEAIKTAEPSYTMYHFDEHGRYFVNENGLKIYKSDCSSKAYIMDENGTMLEIKIDGSQVMFVSDSDYLKYHVGDALKKGMAQVFLYQPDDPISYLANFLVKYRKNVVAEEERQEDLDDLLLRHDRKC